MKTTGQSPGRIKPMVKRGRVRSGATVWMDFRPWEWPELPHGDGCIVFDVLDSLMTGYVTCQADYFGLFKPHGNYGNGSLHVKAADIISV
jgi:hypothetical protein